MYIIIKLLSYYYYFIIIFFPHERRGLHDPILVLINSISSSSYLYAVYKNIEKYNQQLGNKKLTGTMLTLYTIYIPYQHGETKYTQLMVAWVSSLEKRQVKV